MTGYGNNYTQFSGDGSIEAGWPAQEEWLSYGQLWNGYKELSGTSCDVALNVSNNSPEDTYNLEYAIGEVANSSLVPPEFALAIMM